MKSTIVYMKNPFSNRNYSISYAGKNYSMTNSMKYFLLLSFIRYESGLFKDYTECAYKI